MAPELVLEFNCGPDRVSSEPIYRLIFTHRGLRPNEALLVEVAFGVVAGGERSHVCYIFDPQREDPQIQHLGRYGAKFVAKLVDVILKRKHLGK